MLTLIVLATIASPLLLTGLLLSLRARAKDTASTAYSYLEEALAEARRFGGLPLRKR
jgi:hypothetical protein